MAKYSLFPLFPALTDNFFSKTYVQQSNYFYHAISPPASFLAAPLAQNSKVLYDGFISG
jgi:hypothetical protein